MKNLTGQRFGRLTALARRRLTTSSGQRATFYDCVCDCGRSHTVRHDNLVTGAIQSCGCLMVERVRTRRTTHGLSGTREYITWANMLARCENLTHASYHNYGARGIAVCERWHTFEHFLADMGPKPPHLTLERIDVHRGYEPTNCRWATRSEQQHNRRNTQ